MKTLGECGYCHEQRLQSQLVLVAANGRKPTWACLTCLDSVREWFEVEAECPACRASADLLDAAFRAQQHWLRTGQPVAVHSPGTGFHHVAGCPNEEL